ncbi:MAG TPA: acyl-CoA dehydrogenase family protein [Terriglobales bacterium]|nr:acyl-CoA dehydrogenase family protein [Terriglobales bacterium]
MRLALTDDQEALRDELRAYFSDLMTPEVEAEMSNGEWGGSRYRELSLRMGRDGWLGIGWPKEYGGQGRSAVEQFIFFDEAQRAGAPVPFLTINTVGPTLMRYGTEEQRAAFLPRILRGEVHFSIGYSEPDAGTDLASLRTSAVFDGDEWTINGSKLWTSLVQDADYVWLAARTDPDAKKHRGISIFIVPTAAQGFRFSPIQTIGDGSTNATFYEDVRVPHSALVGEVNQGWSLITNQLNLERVALCAPGGVQRLFEDVCAWARETRLAGGGRVVDQEWVRLHLARIHAGLEFLKLINWKSAWALTQGRIDPADASATKVFGTEFFCQAYRLMLEVMGPAGAVKRGSPEAILRGRVERSYRGTLILTFGGGTNEVQRDLISVFGLGMQVRR